MKTAWLWIVLFLISLSYKGLSYEKIEGHHVHEAFMNQEAPVNLLIAIPDAPPNPLRESLPVQTDPMAIWIPGYWEWSLERSEFIWCSGCWRRPPPDHQWIEGQWKQFDEGWVRLIGFWSRIPQEELTFFNQTPPDPFDENPKNPPGDDYFWMSGYWKYQRNKYIWYKGKWERLDERWVYVPAKYIRWPDGYVFVPAFWDWPLEERGVAYACISMPYSHEIEYLPSMILEPDAIIEGCLFSYPDYYYFYYTYCHFHEEWWGGCAACPPWWGWEFWWWMPWWDQWGIWWWWCHPGFPAPFWLNASVIDVMPGPPAALISRMKGIPRPIVLGPKGAIPPGDLINAAGNRPILLENFMQIQEKAGKNLKSGSTNRPEGAEVSHNELQEIAPSSPQTTPRPPTGAQAGEQPEIPDVSLPTIETPQKPEIPEQIPQTQQPGTPSYQQPQWPSYQTPQMPQEPSYEAPSYYQPPSYYEPPRRWAQPPSYEPQWPQQEPSLPSYQPPHTHHHPSNESPRRWIHPPSYQPPSEATPSYPQTTPPQMTTPQYNPPAQQQYTPEIQTPRYHYVQPGRIQPQTPNQQQ